jgi:peptidoglycan/xylan/chitin deacetylase (PgdA/CDA1 family)
MVFPRVKRVCSVFLRHNGTKVAVAFFVVAFLAFRGYSHAEKFIDNEMLDIDSSPSPILTTQASSVVSQDASTAVFVSTTSMTIPVLVYHKIHRPDLLALTQEKSSDMHYSVEEAVFKDQMSFIASQGYTPLTMQEIITDKKKGVFPLRPIAITFDDGWRSQYDVALPVLESYHFPATFYIYTGAVGGGAYMSWKDIGDLVDKQMEIGSHTKTHPKLTKLDTEKLDDELIGSRAILEKRLHISVSDFAYPYGIYNQHVMDEVKKVGYTSARTSKPKLADTFDDLYQIRVIYAPDTVEGLKKRLQ